MNGSRLRQLSLIIAIAMLLASCHSSKKITGSSTPSRAGQRPTAANTPAQAAASHSQAAHLNHSRRKLLRETYAPMLKVSTSKIKNYRLYQFIDEWYGVPYRLGGTTQSGVDCSGFAQQLYKNVYGRTIVRTSGQQYKSSKHKRRKRRLREGDLVFFTGGGDGISHVGVYLKNGYFVHSASSKGVMISNLNDTYWKKVFTAGGKVKQRKSQ